MKDAHVNARTKKQTRRSATKGFDYGSIPIEEKKVLLEIVAALNSIARKSTEEIFDFGRRFAEAIDAPEIGKPDCPAERQAVEKAKQRLSGLLTKGFTADRGGADRHGRQLVSFRLADGRDAGDVLMSEGLAQDWPNSGNRWCGR